MQYSTLFAAVMATSVAASPALNGRQTSCEDEVNACRIAPGSNQAFCSAQYAGCLGYNPYNGTSTGTTSAPAPITTATSCSALYDACRGAPDANFATCAASYAGCLGYNPFDNSGSLNTTAPAYVTTVVTAITTYCPSATTLTYGNKTYTVPGPTTLTITDCPCTITTPVVPAGPGATTAPGVVIPGTTITGESGAVTTIEPSTVPAPQGTPIVPTTIPAGAPSTTNGAASGTATGPASYTGGADIKKPAFGLLALGVLALL